ncbi:hypothetical protein [Pseudomonas fulva]|nr:hypothetical protein [Pseudomonas fulva]MBF8779972.1 hypothetical protein [Pseudomonas fulva]
MKGTALSALFAAATLLASPVFAAEDLCEINLQKINDMKVTQTATTAGDAATGGPGANIDEQVQKAQQAKASGNTEDCISITGKILQDLENREKGSNGR